MTNWPDCEFIIIERDDDERTKTAPPIDKTGWETVIFVMGDEEDG